MSLCGHLGGGGLGENLGVIADQLAHLVRHDVQLKFMVAIDEDEDDEPPMVMVMSPSTAIILIAMSDGRPLSLPLLPWVLPLPWAVRRQYNGSATAVRRKRELKHGRR